MKKIFISLVALVLSLCVNAQLDTVRPNITRDTVKAIFMVCDTSKYPHWDRDTSYSDYFYAMEYKFGYVVREQYSYGNIFGIPIRCNPYQNVIGYLNSSKKEFAKEIIIWDYKLVK
jgi:hypothetical protein